MKNLALLATLVAMASVGSAIEAAPMTLEDVSSLRQVTTVRMSPAGDSVAYLLQVQRALYEDPDGLPYHELHVTDLDGNSKPYVTGDIDITDIAWAVDGESIFFVAKRDAEADFNSLYLTACSGGISRSDPLRRG